jgi:DNA mismatch repair protein MSH6
MGLTHLKHIHKSYFLQNTDAKQVEGGSSESWPHLKLDFLKPNKIRDAKRRTLADPDYDRKTLFVPEEFKRNLTPVSD